MDAAFCFDSFITLTVIFMAFRLAKTLFSQVVCGEILAVYGIILCIKALGLTHQIGGYFYLIPFSIQILVAFVAMSTIPRCIIGESIYYIQALVNLASAILFSTSVTWVYDNYAAIMGLLDCAKLVAIIWCWRCACADGYLDYHRGVLPWQTR